MTNRRLSLVSPNFLKTADDFPNSSRRVTMFDLRGTKPQRKLSTSNFLAKCKGNKETSILEFEGNRELSTVGERDRFHLSKMEPVPSAPEQPVVGIKEDEENLISGTVTWRLYWKYFKEGLPLPMILVLAVSLIAAQGNNSFH